MMDQWKDLRSAGIPPLIFSRNIHKQKPARVDSVMSAPPQEPHILPGFGPLVKARKDARIQTLDAWLNTGDSSPCHNSYLFR